MFFFVQWWSFYKPPPPPNPHDSDANNACYENTSLFLITIYQYLVVAMAFSISKPFRQPIYTNLWFTLSLLILFVFSIYITIADDNWIHSMFDIMNGINYEFRLSVLIIAFINGVLTYFYEKIIIWYLSLWWKNRKEKMHDLKMKQEMEENLQ